MLKSTTLVGLVVLAAALCAQPASAQEARAVADVMFGWTFSDGVSGTAAPIAGVVYNRIDPKDSFKWGLSAGVLVGEHAEAGFLFGQQRSMLQLGGATTRDIGDFTINTYHGYFAYNFGDSSMPIRPYIMGGLGATNFGAVDYTSLITGQPAQTGSATKFSSTWGAGVKFFPTPHVGARVGVQWTPTYIKSDPGGWWCDPFWGCYLVGNAQYANQIDISGGISFRF